jgi:hypothetical protein
MEAPRAEPLTPWVGKWENLVEFEIASVEIWAEYWGKIQPRKTVI